MARKSNAAKAAEAAAANAEKAAEAAEQEKEGEVTELSEDFVSAYEGKRVFTEDEVKKLIAEAMEKAAMEAASKSNVTIYNTSPEEVVTLLYVDEVAPDSVLNLDSFGSITAGSTLDVPKKMFGASFMSTLVRKLLKKRTLVVLGGLTEDERVRWNANYKIGEAMDEKFFDRMLDFSVDELGNIYGKLCDEHKEMVCRRFITAKEVRDNRVSIEKVKEINGKSTGTSAAGMLKGVLKAFGQEIQND